MAFVVSLIAAPGALEPSHVRAVRDAFGGGDATWLSGGEAAEFGVAARPSMLGHVAGEMRMLGVDVNCLPAAGRRRRLLLADMDSTMIGQECIDELADLAGVGAQVAAITDRAMAGEVDFEGALEARVALLEGLPEDAIRRVIAERLTLAPGGAALVGSMRAAGARCVLVSGGFTAFTGWVAGRLGFDAHRANVLEARAGVLTGRAARPYLGREAKVTALEEECAALGIGAAEALAVGDGANDSGMVAAAGLGVAMHARAALREVADARVDHGDLTAPLWLQGYRADEVVER